MLDVKKCLSDSEDKMDMSVLHLEETLAQIRAGKANIHILDDLRVNSYGSMVPINNVAAVSTPDSRTIAIKPWEKSMFHVIEKAIIDSTIGIMPEKLKKAIKDGLAEDVEKDAENDLQKIHDKKIKQIEELLAAKNKEIMTV